MVKRFESVEERRAYWRQWYENNKHRADYKAADKATKQRIRKERREWWAEYRKDFKCKNCGIADFRVLDFHHRDPAEKDLEIANLVGRARSVEGILLELEKCDCLCSNCHRIHHWEEKNLK